MLIAPTLPPAYEEEEQPATTTTTTTATTTTTESSTIANSVEPSQALLAPATPAAVPHVDYSSEEPVIESIGQAAALSASHALLDTNNQQAEEYASVDASTADKNDVHLQAAKLLIAGVKQTSHDQAAVLRSNRVTLGRPPVSSSSSTSTTATTTTVRTTPAMLTSTETVTEISSTQERIRGYRRFAQKRVGGSAATLRRQAQLPRGTKPTTSSSSSRGTTTTTQRSTTATRSYQERLAASRLRLSRLSLATKPTTTSTATTTASSSTTAATSRATTPGSTRTTASPLSPVRAGAEQSPNRKLSVRNIDRETGQQRASWDSVQSSLQRFQVQRGNRVYTPATRASSSSRSTTPSSTTTSRPAISSTQSPQRGRNRHVVSYRTQAPQQQQRTRGTTTPRSTTTTTQRTTAAAALSTLTQQISAIASGYTYTPAPPNPLNTYTSAASAQTLQQQQLTQQQLPSSASLSSQQQPQQLQSTSSLSPSSAFLPFDKLTRAIVDESILQNFKSTNAQRGSTASNSQQQRQQQQQRVAKPATASSNNYNYPKPTAPGKHSSNLQHSY